MNPRGGSTAGYGEAHNRVGNVNQGQARPGQPRTVKCYNCNGRPDNAFDDDVNKQPVQDLALNVDNVFQAEDCDAFDLDVDEAPTAQTMFMANLSSADPITDEARPSYDSDILSEEETLKRELHFIKLQLASTINCNKLMVEETTFLKQDFKQKKNKLLADFLNMKSLKEKVKDRLVKQDQSLQTVHMLCRPRPQYNDLNKVAIGYKNPLCLTHAKQAQPALYNGHEILKDNYAPAKVHNTEDTLEIAEITRKKMNAKMTDPECVTHKVKIAPHDYSKENLLATFTPHKQLTPKQIYWSNDLMKLKSEALKERAKGIQKALTQEVKEMKDVFEELEAEVAQCAVDRKHDAIDLKNLLIANDNLIAECLSKEVFSVATKSELNVARFAKMHVANTYVKARCLALEAELATLRQTLPVSKLGCVLCHDAVVFCLRRLPAFCLKVTAFCYKTKLRFASRPSAFCSRTHCDLSQGDTRPPMLDRTVFASWRQRIRLHCRGKDNEFGPKRPRVYSDLNSKEKDRYNVDIRATNILLQGLPKDIYTIINYYTDAKDIWDNVKMLLDGSELTKEDRESQLYDDFGHFRQHKEELIYDYYNEGRFVTAVKLNRGLRDSNYDQRFAYLKQHEAHAKENKIILERLSQPTTQPTVDPLALLSNASYTQHGSPSSSTLSFTQPPPPRANSMKDGRVVVQNVQGRPNRGQGMNARGGSAVGYGEAHNRVGNVNQGQARPGQARTVKCYNCNADLITDEAGPSYDSDILFEYVKDNEVPVVHNNASSVPNDTFMMIYNDMCEPSALFVSNSSRNAVVKNSLTAKLATYREQVELPRPLYNDLNKVAIGYKNPLCLTRAKQAQPALYNGHEILKDNHAPAQVHNAEDTLEIAEITRKKMNAKMTDPECVTHKLKSEALKERAKVSRPIKAFTVYPPNTPATLVPKVLPTKNQVKIHIFTLIQMFSEFDKTCKKRITPTAITDGERGFEQTKACYFQEVIPFFKTIKDNFEGIQKALTKEVKEIKDVFEELEAEVAQCVVDRKHDAIDQKNLLIANDNLIAECLSKEVFSVATKSKLNVARFAEMHVANTSVEARCLALEAELATLHVESIVPRLRNNRDAHLDYLRHLKESVETIREIVEEAKVPKSNPKTNRISPAKGANKLPVEDLPRTNKSHLKMMNRVDSSSRLKRTIINLNSNSMCRTCNKCLTSFDHDMCVAICMKSVVRPHSTRHNCEIERKIKQ
nr:hypothetical protein [Tanacetum cinerariifolium]